MIIAYHAIFSAHGFWLPNDPRGSWSDFVALWELVRFGKATKTNQRGSLAHAPHDQKKRVEAKQSLRYPAVLFNGRQALAVAHGFARACVEADYVLLACAILPDHVHLVVHRHARPIERVVGHLKAEATRQLNREGMHPFADVRTGGGSRPSPWTHGCWKVYLNESDVERAIQYVNDNPVKEGKRRQTWSFVGAV